MGVMTDRALFLLDRLVHGTLRQQGFYLRMAAETKLRSSILPQMQSPDISMRFMAFAAIVILDRFMDTGFFQISLNLLLVAFCAAAAAKPGLLSLRKNTG
jgi:hypothetical protein